MKKGFTLVELAIVMVIIGLLVGGVLAGQELIKQAKIKKMITMIQDMDRTWNTFYLKYNGLPGDLKNPTRFFSACLNAINGNPVPSGNGNGSLICDQIDCPERLCVWPHLAMSGLYNPAGLKEDFWGPNDPPHDINFMNGDGYEVALWAGGHAGISTGDVWDEEATKNKNLLSLYGINTGFITPEALLSMDQKMDDGKPFTGRMRAYGGWSGCFTEPDGDNSNLSTATSEYDLTITQKVCYPGYYF